MTGVQEVSQPRRNQGPLLRFSKMHGLGNDFMVVDAISQPFRLRPEMIRELADRNVGIGFDQLLVVEPPGLPDVDFRYRIFNADGSEVEQCGNGARCFAKFVRDQRLTNKTIIRVQTARGVIELKLLKDGMVVVNMGVPELNPPAIPFAAERRKRRIPWRLVQKQWSLALFLWAIPTPLLWLMMWKPRRSQTLGHAWKAIRDSRRGPILVFCR